MLNLTVNNLTNLTGLDQEVVKQWQLTHYRGIKKLQQELRELKPEIIEIIGSVITGRNLESYINLRKQGG